MAMATASIDPRQAAEAAQELLKRQRARSHLLDFTGYTFPGYKVNWHHRLIAEILTGVYQGRYKNVMIFAPPRHGKSELVSRRFPAWLHGVNPDLKIMASSYASPLARRMNRDIQRIIESPGYRRLFPDTKLGGDNSRGYAGNWLKNSDEYEPVGSKGFYRGAGVGGSFTGMGFDIGIVDDPFKGAKEANSATIRKSTWEWFTTVFLTRAAPDAKIVMIFTRWHEDDLAGRIEAGEVEGFGNWDKFHLPALAEFDTEYPQPEYDPRQPGMALWPAQYNLEWLETMRKQLGSYEWNAIYMQRPKPPEGNLIKRGWFETVNIAPIVADRVRYWDKAGTEGGGAYTAGVLIARDKRGVFYIEDVVRGQWSAFERETIIKQTARADALRGMTPVITFIEQEPGSSGKEAAEATIRNLAGFPIYADSPTGDKDYRLRPFAAQAEARNVLIVEGDWNAAWINEITARPFSKYRDQADATSGAFNKLTAGTGGFAIDQEIGEWINVFR